MALLKSNTQIYGTANVQSVLVVGNITPNNATSNITGSLQVSGGAGITGNLYSGNIVITGASNGITFVDGTRMTTAASGSGGSSSGYLANSIIFANTTGYLSNTANIQYFESNNNLQLANTITAANLVLTGTTAGASGSIGSLKVSGGAYFGLNVYGAGGFDTTSSYKIAGTGILNGQYLNLSLGSLNSNGAALRNGDGATQGGIQSGGAIYNNVSDTGSTSLVYFNKFKSSNVQSASGTVTYQNLATLVIDPPTWNIGNTNITVTNPWSLYANGAIYSNTNIRAANTFFAGSNGITFADGTKQTTAASGSGGSSNSFSTILVSGQPNVIANTSTSPLTIVAGSGIYITTDGSANSITFNSTGGFSGGTIANQFIVANSISSTSTTTGALQVQGGVGVTGNLWAGQLYQTSTKVSIGFNAGSTNQGASAIAIGNGAGNQNADQDSISIGHNAGNSGMGQFGIAIGEGAGNINSGNNYTVAIGKYAGNNYQGDSATAVGPYAGQSQQGSAATAIGYNAGVNNQGSGSVAAGWEAGNDTQGIRAVAIGQQAGQTSQNAYSVAIGYQSGQTGQQTNSVAIGYLTGQTNQGAGAIAIGDSAGNITQGGGSIAMGPNSGYDSQSDYAIAIGTSAGSSTQGLQSISIGQSSGQTNQHSQSIAIGASSGSTNQGNGAISLGYSAGNGSQGNYAVAIGFLAGSTAQTLDAVAIGDNAGNDTQGDSAVAVGPYSGQTLQGTSSVAVGDNAGNNAQGATAVAIGKGAGSSHQGNNAIAIGSFAGSTNQPDSSIIFNASGSILDVSNAGLYVNPVRNDTANTTQAVYYNTSTKELTYAPPASGGGVSTSGWLPNSVIFANSAGYLSNTNNLSFFTSNNSLVLQGSSSTSNSTGALQIQGGLGITGNVYMKGSANITAKAVITDDMLSIDTAGYAVTTAGLNAINVRYQGGAAAIEGTAVRVDAIPGSTAGGTWNSYRILQSAGASTGVVANGVKFDNITPAGGTDNMIYAGTGWDSIININGAQFVNGNGAIKLITGTVNEAPIYANANGVLLTTATQGAIEVTSNNIYYTSNTSTGTGRGIVLTPEYGRLAANAAVASGGAFFTNTIRPQLRGGQVHHFKYFLVFQKNTAGTVTYSFTPSAGVFTQLHAEARTYVQGAVSAAVTNMASIACNNSATTNSTASASLAASAICMAVIEGYVRPSVDCRLQLNVTCSAGTINSALGSNFMIVPLGADNIGNIG